MTTTPKIDTTAPERIWAIPDEDGDWLHGFCSNALSDQKGAEYIRADLADARAAAAAHVLWEARHYVEAYDTPEHNPEQKRVLDLIDAALTPPADTQAALDRLIAERVRVEVEAEREACISIMEELYCCLSCGATFLSSKGHYDEDCPKNRAAWDGASFDQKVAAIRARGSKEGQS